MTVPTETFLRDPKFMNPRARYHRFKPTMKNNVFAILARDCNCFFSIAPHFGTANMVVPSGTRQAKIGESIWFRACRGEFPVDGVCAPDFATSNPYIEIETSIRHNRASYELFKKFPRSYYYFIEKKKKKMSLAFERAQKRVKTDKEIVEARRRRACRRRRRAK